jgi:hypothetical protein
LKIHERSTICYQTKDEAEQVHQQFVRISSGLEPEHLEIYRKFKLSGNPLPRKRMEGKIIEKSINQVVTTLFRNCLYSKELFKNLVNWG